MKTSTFQTDNNITGLSSITFMPAERGLMLSRLESLRQMALSALENQNNQQSNSKTSNNQSSC